MNSKSNIYSSSIKNIEDSIVYVDKLDRKNSNGKSNAKLLN